ncbi:GNAT family N-acetyltransferase [Actinoplanes sp. NPDC026670]|uniref:GNAT family N-acetyltransferase n=1 Tax=Actinoplanes sp. NPDC026670 TaxID=3154700 RepID=UPI0033CD0958
MRSSTDAAERIAGSLSGPDGLMASPGTSRCALPGPSGQEPPPSIGDDTAGVDALAVDGGIITIRPVVASDRRELAGLYSGAELENLRLRFFSYPAAATLAAEVDRLCRPPSDRFLALVACEAGRLLGVASCERLDYGSRAEFAVFVADHDHGRGIGTLLLEHLASRARRLGVTELVGEVLPGNRDMLGVAHDLSPRAWAHFEQGVVDVSVHTGEDEQTRQAVDDRDRTAERASLQALLRPRAIAVIGAGHPDGRRMVRTLQEYGFTGRMYAIAPAGTSIDGLPVHESLRTVPEPADLLIIDLPADQIPGVLADGAAVSARAAVLVRPAGTGTDGPPLLAATVRLARSLGIRLLGPGSRGVVNTDAQVHLHTGVTPGIPLAGGLGVASDCDEVAAAVVDRAGGGVSTLAVVGDQADIGGIDLLAYWFDDPATHAVVLALESIGNPRKFARAVQAISRRKPVLALDNGHPVTRALLGQAGAIITGSVAELVDTARLLTCQPLPSGRWLAVISNTGTPGTVAADAAHTAGLRMTPLRGPARRRLAVLVSPDAAVGNPVYLGPDATPQSFAAAATALAGLGTLDMMLLVIAPSRVARPEEFLAALQPALARYPDLTWAITITPDDGALRRPHGQHPPVFGAPEHAVRALAHAADYADRRHLPHPRRTDPTGIDARQAHATIHAALPTGHGWQPPNRTAGILAAYGIMISTPPALPVRAGLIVGLVQDPEFGPLLQLTADNDARTPAGDMIRLVPMTDLDVDQMWRSLRYAPLLTRPAGRALKDLLSRMDRLGNNHPEIAELHLQAMLTDPDRICVTGARLRLAPPRPHDDPLLRQLPQPGAG